MGGKSRSSMLHEAACVELLRPWQRHGRRGVKITIIVIEVLRVVYDTVQWGGPLEGALAAAIGLLFLESAYDAVRYVVTKFARMTPERVVLDRRDGKRRLVFGW
ncbi:hypothetical protein AQJ43_36965 [Streptomyces avermitilis]|uniref:Uncharacterized protein n=2 Tax=Streptomyces avermitilis TaxID=33903 RepID=A0A143SZE5_STRAW|nr:hypothetical protein [Streptomyces avermitilis]KUN47743.1 hypothetical protein AQJ43_36965 [Streptomyces avermitilis]BAU77488.1 hypothetical protein SAVERM_2p044 [Streptomyces avermitilis MA-4680 = NBRC 14893]BBJ56296.1 hypothetical protein SAVMC3_89250 [Streptomyces avermitilis]GDY70157.1 hypothetical protein SAV14893_095500 [Streptomyces avermitilis]